MRRQRNPGMVAAVNLPGLSELRQEIDAVDAQILSLLQRRLELVFKVGEVKSAHGVKVYDPERERMVLAKLGNLAKPPMSSDMVRRIFERIIDEFRSQEKHHIQEL